MIIRGPLPKIGALSSIFRCDASFAFRSSLSFSSTEIFMDCSRMTLTINGCVKKEERKESAPARLQRHSFRGTNHGIIRESVPPRNLHDRVHGYQIVTGIEHCCIALPVANVDKLDCVQQPYPCRAPKTLTYRKSSSTTSSRPDTAAVSTASLKSLSCFDSATDWFHRLCFR